MRGGVNKERARRRDDGERKNVAMGRHHGARGPIANGLTCKVVSCGGGTLSYWPPALPQWPDALPCRPVVLTYRLLHAAGELQCPVHPCFPVSS